MTWPAIVIWALIIIASFLRGPWLIYLFMMLAAFGSLQMVPGEGVGGANILPQSVCAVFLVARVMLIPGNIDRALRAWLDPNRLGFLFAFLCWALLTAYLMPRLFDHRVDVIPTSFVVPWPVALTPTSANLTQSGYVFLSVTATTVFYLMGTNHYFCKHYLKALVVGGLTLIVTGVLDTALSSAGHAEMLAPFRTASYALLSDDAVLGMKRMVGLLPEASVYGAICVTLASNLVFLRPCYEPIWRDCLVPLTLFGLLIVAFLSTSSTALVGLALLGVLVILNWTRRVRAITPSAHQGLKGELVFGFIAAVGIIVCLVLKPEILEPLVNLFDVGVLKKASSDSYVERSMWSATATNAFMATYGLGVGLGAARTSNWFISILSNTGVVGTGLLGLFFLSVGFRGTQSSGLAYEMATGLRLALVAPFVMLGLAWTNPDFGLVNAASLGVLASLCGIKGQHVNRGGRRLRRQG